MSVGVALSTILMPAYRIAGITLQPGVIPNADRYTEAIGEVNRLLGLWNCNGHLIYDTTIVSKALTAGLKTYTIGPGGDIDTARPIAIPYATLLFPTTPVVRRPLRILSDAEWAAVAIQDLSGSPPFELYYDGGLNATTGRASIYLRFQPPAGYSLELWTWNALKTTFTASTDTAVFPPGYEMALTFNLAKSLAAFDPAKATMTAQAYKIADQSLAALISLNTTSPRLANDPALTGPDDGPGFGWLSGPF